MKISLLVRFVIILSSIPPLILALFPGKIVLVSIASLYPCIISTICLHYVIFRKITGWKLIWLFCLFNITLVLRGLYLNTSNIQDLGKLLYSGVSLAFLFPISIYVGANFDVIKKLLFSFYKYGIPLICLLILFPSDPGPYGFSHTIAPVFLFILLLPYLPGKIRWIIIFLSAIGFFFDITARSAMTNIIVTYSILFSYFFKDKKITIYLIKISHFAFIILPLIFAILGATRIFNIFKIGDYLSNLTISDSSGDIQNIFIDSRTAIYQDVYSALSTDPIKLITGLGFNGKTSTFLSEKGFGELYREGRGSTESGMLTYIQYGGIIGLCIYYSLFIFSSYFSIYRSRNWLSKMLGVWISFKGAFSFIEDALVFNISILFLFIAIGMALNVKIRTMTDSHLKLLIHISMDKLKYLKTQLIYSQYHES